MGRKCWFYLFLSLTLGCALEIWGEPARNSKVNKPEGGPKIGTEPNSNPKGPSIAEAPENAGVIKSINELNTTVGKMSAAPRADQNLQTQYQTQTAAVLNAKQALDDAAASGEYNTANYEELQAQYAAQLARAMQQGGQTPSGQGSGGSGSGSNSAPATSSPAPIAMGANGSGVENGGAPPPTPQVSGVQQPENPEVVDLSALPPEVKREAESEGSPSGPAFPTPIAGHLGEETERSLMNDPAKTSAPAESEPAAKEKAQAQAPTGISGLTREGQTTVPEKDKKVPKSVITRLADLIKKAVNDGKKRLTGSEEESALSTGSGASAPSRSVASTSSEEGREGSASETTDNGSPSARARNADSRSPAGKWGQRGGDDASEDSTPWAPLVLLAAAVGFSFYFFVSRKKS